MKRLKPGAAGSVMGAMRHWMAEKAAPLRPEKAVEEKARALTGMGLVPGMEREMTGVAGTRFSSVAVRI